MPLGTEVKLVRTWIREHNRQVKSSGKDVRILPLFMPKQSPWLNPIEPKWVYGKRAVFEPNGLLTAKELAQRICAYYRCAYEAYLALPEKVSCVCTSYLLDLIRDCLNEGLNLIFGVSGDQIAVHNDIGGRGCEYSTSV